MTIMKQVWKRELRDSLKNSLRGLKGIFFSVYQKLLCVHGLRLHAHTALDLCDFCFVHSLWNKLVLFAELSYKKFWSLLVRSVQEFDAEVHCFCRKVVIRLQDQMTKKLVE